MCAEAGRKFPILDTKRGGYGALPVLSLPSSTALELHSTWISTTSPSAGRGSLVPLLPEQRRITVLGICIEALIDFLNSGLFSSPSESHASTHRKILCILLTFDCALMWHWNCMSWLLWVSCSADMGATNTCALLSFKRKSLISISSSPTTLHANAENRQHL